MNMMMMIKEKRDVRPLLVKFGVALAISFAGFLYSRVRNRRIKPSEPCSPSISDSDRRVDYGGRIRIKGDHQPEMDSADSYDKPCIRVCEDSSPSSRYSGHRDGYLLPEFDELVKDLNASTASKGEAHTVDKDLARTIYSVERDEYEHEIENLKRRVRFLCERERKLEVQLLEYYGLKEQETAIMDLYNRLKIKNIEVKVSSMKIDSLQEENRRLATQVADYSKVVSELEDAKGKIKVLKRKIRHEAQQNKEQIIELTQRVAKLRDHEPVASTSSSDVHSELQRLIDLKSEAMELRRSNEDLQQENADLAQKLESTQFLANSLLEDPEKEELNKEMLHLKEENENLTKEVERLQTDRCSDVEELVYLRWINACLRYELRNYQPPPGKTVARDLSKCLSPKSEMKAKELILEYSNAEDGDHREPSLVDYDFDQWPSSQPSYLTDSTEHEKSPGHNSATKHHNKKLKIFSKLRKLIRGIQGHHHNQSSEASAMYRSFSVDDLRKRYSPESQYGNSYYEGGIDGSPRLASSSQYSNNSSLEYQPLSRLDEEDPKDIEKANNTSNSRYSPGGVRFVLGSESIGSTPLGHISEQDSEDGQKSELAKYAEVLRDSRSLPRRHKKSASYSAG